MKTLKVLFSVALLFSACTLVGCSGETTPEETPAAETDTPDADAPAEGSGDKPAEGSGDKPAE